MRFSTRGGDMFTFTPTQAPSPSPGQYRVSRGEKRAKIMIGCPGCEGEHQLGKHHMVTASGVVNPPIRCPFFGCGWSKASKLADWQTEE